MEDLVVGAFMPSSPDTISDPVILHKDGDYHNCKLSNLEWAERSSTAYQNYLIKRKSDIIAVLRTAKGNNNRAILINRLKP